MSKRVLIDVDKLEKIFCDEYGNNPYDTGFYNAVDQATIAPEQGDWEKDIDSYTDSDGVIHDFITFDGFDHAMPQVLQGYIKSLIAQAEQRGRQEERERCVGKIKDKCYSDIHELWEPDLFELIEKAIKEGE